MVRSYIRGRKNFQTQKVYVVITTLQDQLDEITARTQELVQAAVGPIDP
jgi:uncharacterized protein (UPF0333 family)